MFIVIKLIFKGEKMQTLVTNLAMIRGVKALSEEIEAIDKEILDNYNMVINYICMFYF